jgi:hypothetical protein
MFKQIARGELESVKQAVMDQDAELDLHMVDRQSSTFLHAIASCRSRSAGTHLEEIAAILLAEGVSLDSRDATNSTPLHLAAANGHISLVEVFLKFGADSQLKNRQGRTALLVAQVTGQNTIAELLVHRQQLDIAQRVPLFTQKVTLVSKTNNTVTVSWTVTGQSNEPCLFELQVGRARGVMALQGWQQTYKEVEGTLYVVEELQPGCAYVVRVRAYNKFKAGAWARSSVMTTQAGKEKEGAAGGGGGVFGGIANKFAQAVGKAGQALPLEEAGRYVSGTTPTNSQTYQDVDRLIALLLKEAAGLKESEESKERRGGSAEVVGAGGGACEEEEPAKGEDGASPANESERAQKYAELTAANPPSAANEVPVVPLGDRVAKLNQQVSLLQATLAATKTILANTQVLHSHPPHSSFTLFFRSLSSTSNCKQAPTPRYLHSAHSRTTSRTMSIVRWTSPPSRITLPPVRGGAAKMLTRALARVPRMATAVSAVLEVAGRGGARRRLWKRW